METLNHIIIYNGMFNLVSNCRIYNLCCIISNVQMATLHLNMNCIYNKILPLFCLNLINTKKTPN